ncbi:hypothetical protein RDI58_001096 [Solanum bulbocastanum]|uniref:Uncharacterized protein n=1 Tax=Solanum bulbocastanum TaxID=147425 RepID=A0AAN8YSY9_SOLBU
MIPNRSIVLLLILFAVGSTVAWTNKFGCGEFLQHLVLLSISANRFYAEREGSRMKKEVCSCLRARLVESLIQSAQDLQVSPIVKYSVLSLFADRFYPSLTGEGTKDDKSWLLRPLRKSNLQLFALVAIWISSKIHDSPSLSVNPSSLWLTTPLKSNILQQRIF